jgi:hypothetical protein
LNSLVMICHCTCSCRPALVPSSSTCPPWWASLPQPQHQVQGAWAHPLLPPRGQGCVGAWATRTG